MKTLYRYETECYNTNVTLYELRFKVIKETPCGYWINHYYDLRGKKWVSKTARSRYAYPTKEEALIHHYKRTQRYINILKSKLSVAKEGVKLSSTALGYSIAPIKINSLSG